jgi:hypothetical protein
MPARFTRWVNRLGNNCRGQSLTWRTATLGVLCRHWRYAYLNCVRGAALREAARRRPSPADRRFRADWVFRAELRLCEIAGLAS